MKAFDCIQMKHEAQERIYRDTKGMSREEERTYFQRAAEEFRQEMRAQIRTSKSGGAKWNPSSDDIGESNGRVFRMFSTKKARHCNET